MRRIRKHVSQSAPQIRRGAKPKRQAYADLRHLVSLEPLAKKLRLPFLQRAFRNSIGNNSINAPETAATRSGAGVEPPGRNGETATLPEPHNVLLVIDQRLSMYYGSKQKMKSVIAAEAAALVAWHAFAQKDRLGGIIFNDHEVSVLSPYYSRVQIMLIFHDLLNLNHRLSSNSERKSNPGMLNQALRRAATTADGNGNFQIVLVTDGSGQDQVTGQILHGISAQNDVAVFLVYDPRQVDCIDGNRSKSVHQMSFRPNINNAPLFADGTLTIPLNNQLDAVDQFRRGFRKLLRLRRHQSKQEAQSSQSCGAHLVQTGAILEKRGGENETAISPLPSTLETTQSPCAQLNSR